MNVRGIPPEVQTDLCGRQILALKADGQAFRQYLECDGGCGYLIGCGDAVESVSHDSCLPVNQ